MIERCRAILARKEEIIANHQKAMQRQQKAEPNQPLVESLAAVLDEEDATRPCLACHL